jgi:hypothetical protein
MPIDTWVDEKGKNVEEIPFFKTVYTDELSRKLNYNPHFRSGEIDNRGFHTSHETHEFAERLARIYHSLGKFVGLEMPALEEYSKIQSCYGEQDTLLSMGFLRKKEVKGKIVLFPTEKLVSLGFEKRKY